MIPTYYYRPIDGVEVIAEEIAANTIVEDLLSDVLLYLRVSDEESVSDIREQDTVRSCIAGAIDAAEAYLQKDVWPRDYEILWTYGSPLRIECGAVRSLAINDGDSPVTDLLPSLKVRGSREFRGAGLRVYGDALTFAPRTVTFSTGFPKAVNLPAGVRSFIYSFVGMLHENREMANVGTVKFKFDEVPTYLLDPLKSATMA